MRTKPVAILLAFAICLLTFLTGCVRYEVGVNFVDRHGGEITQHLKLGQQLTALSESEAIAWLDSLERRASQLQGRTKRLSNQEIVVTIPFSNGQDLAAKFNQFFNPNEKEGDRPISPDNLDLVQLNSEMSLRQSNLLLLDRNRLNLQVDLRALGVLSDRGNIIVSPGSLIDIEFALAAPWGVRSLRGDNLLSPELDRNGNQIVWHLQPGQINTIEAVFWMPSLLGLGTVGIIALMLAGFYLKYKRLPGFQPSAAISS